MSNIKLTLAQEKIVDVLQADETAFIIGSGYWNHQLLISKSGSRETHFNKRTREALVSKGVIVLTDITCNKYELKIKPHANKDTILRL